MRGADEMERKAGFPRPMRGFAIGAWAIAMLGLQLAAGISLFIHFETVCR